MNPTSTYTFSLLQYRHSQLLGEILNVGLLIYFPENKILSFVHPNKLSRLTSVYPQVQEKAIKNYLRSFTFKVDNLNNRPEIFADVRLEESFVSFIANELLPPDSSALQFDSPKRGILPFNNIEAVKRRLYATYFSVYDTELNDYQRIDDALLFNKYREFIKFLEAKEEFANSVGHRIKYDYEIKPKVGESFKFDAAWQNGSLNLVKSISFDLSRPDNIQKKAFRYYGEFIELEGYAVEHNWRFDLLLAKPRKKELIPFYDNAVRLLNKPRKISLITEENIEEYSKKTLEEIKADLNDTHLHFN